MLFTEDLLHYVWKFKLFDKQNLQTTDGRAIEIQSAGLHNFNSGPDFQNARIKIGDTVWAGNVEIHLTSADWYKHNHTHDDAYNNVILHVVHVDNGPVTTAAGQLLPTLQLQNRIPESLYLRYHHLMYGKQQIIPCEGSIKAVSQLALVNWLSRMAVERLQKKAEAVLQTLQGNRGNCEETFYQFLAANFGFKVNALPFELLAKSLPLTVIAKHKNSSTQIEALIFGQAGMLDSGFADPYPNILRTEYEFLKKKYSLQPVEKHLWKFMRMRPQNFPTIRLAQFAAFIGQSNHLFSKVLEINANDDLRKLFSNIVVNSYWDKHYRFDVESAELSKSFGVASVDLILMNTVAEFLFAYGEHHKQNQYVDSAIALLESLPAEKNLLVDEFKTLGVKAGNAFESQAMLQLRNSYCNHKKCLNCGVGNELLNTSKP